MNEVWAGLLVGFLSSFHCIGMCGPIALALPTTINNSIYLNTFLYNFGRIITYSFIGLIVGLFGRVIFYNGFQQVLSITMGVLIILGFSISNSKLQKVNSFIGKERFTNLLRKLFSKLFQNANSSKLFFIGIINGFLPCGFVYLAAGNALVIPGGIEKSILYMLLFGVGTFPLMFILVISKSIVSLKVRGIISKSVPYLAILMGILLIFRGLELNIPYLSPLIDFSTSGEVDSTCE